MRIRNVLSLLAVAGLLAPLAALAAPPCVPGPHCPMAAAGGGEAPCHGTAIQRDDCCLSAGEALPVEAVPVVAFKVPVALDATPAPQLDAGVLSPLPAPVDASPTPRYRLYRALLI